MAELIARRDPDNGYLFLSSADEYPIPDDLWQEVRKTHHADYSSAYKGELRISPGEWPAALALMEERGHNLTSVTGHRAGVPRGNVGARGPMECRECGAAYRAGYVVRPGDLCYRCDPPSSLVIVGPGCRPDCACRGGSSCP